MFRWCKDFHGKELMVPYMVSYLLMKCLQPETALKDIKRLWQIRNCLLLLDYDDPSADPIKLLLLRCYMQPMFLKTDEVCNDNVQHYTRYFVPFLIRT